uniref:Zinc finger protein 451 n=1 Tax=Gasterosteus aculeatus aculeatus TaxID=481459 RepID=A0AAQ4QEK0_GASAC|nr:E3 SUMO-protein ligase ZNF451 isoform X2 [Gasterosteus aculeatus aculeatus]XP_040033775.1 E3 SUMO-protein ligase ZNF451 isoform X2 [Gasterosteus aculeatus aculeatus]
MFCFLRQMSSPSEADEDEVEEVEFVSEGTVRPVLECIDLLSEDEGCSSAAGTVEDKITRHKAHVTSTLDRLAQRVALDRKERSDKCKAFKEKQISQRARGQQELAVSSLNGMNQEAKHCVDMWLKMPGLGPGAGFERRRRRPASSPVNRSTRHTCPVINCGRVYDNASLLEGHLKRFDHSPCDPTINVRGCPSNLFACVSCGQQFQTEEAWRKHLEFKVSSLVTDGHSIEQTPQWIVCFACPDCYLLFNLRDECLQHMSAKKHFTESFPMNDTRGGAMPVPVSQYVKNRLIALCKDVTFNVRCSLCHKVLTSHQAAQAHFNVHCRQGCAVATSNKTVAQVVKQLQVRGQCSLCCKIFHSPAEIERHRESTQHVVEVNQTMAKALLQHCRFSEKHHGHAERKRLSGSPERPFQKRNKGRECGESSGKRRRLRGNSVAVWFCECGLQFSEEATATNHLLAVNQIFHQCAVCGKQMGEPSITRLHMSRFHGGAHLSNFLFYCRKCKVEMPRYEDILAHVAEAHSGHTFLTDCEVPEELADSKPSTSGRVDPPASSKSAVRRSVAAETPSAAERTWMCRMCEDTFGSERDVRSHCRDASTHSFQRFICGHCPQKFFKESTVRRHCANEHGGQIQSSHFCGLCDSMRFESEGEFLEHYKSLHSKDYYCMEGVEVVEPAAADGGGGGRPACPCMGSVKGKGEMKATYSQCMRSLSDEEICHYVCGHCDACVPSFAQIKTHVHKVHRALNGDKTFAVECKVCLEIFTHVPGFHNHYHSRHCPLEPCRSSGGCSVKAEATVKALNAVQISPGAEDETLEFSNMDQTNKESEARESEPDEEMNHEPSLSAEAEAESAELEEALKRSLLEY